VDNREPQSIQSLQFGGIPKFINTLDTGDLWASTDDNEFLVIERKTPSDLLNSIKDGRLFQQVAAMRERSKWCYVLVSGALTHTLDGHVITDNRTTGFRYDDVQGALLTVQELGVSLIHCQSDSHYEEAVIRLARRERTAEKSIQPRMKAAFLSPAEQILISLPGIGLERAKLLLSECPDAAHAIAWLTWLDTFHEIAGIGDGTKRNVRKALGLNDDQWLTVFTPEAAEYAASQLATNEQTGTPILDMLPESLIPNQATVN
jgi:ERCC4-type nuclease